MIFCLNTLGETIYVCDGEDLDIVCESGHVMVIKEASYGRSSLDQCGAAGSPGEPCHDPGVMGKLADCYKNRICRLSSEEIRYALYRISYCTHRDPFLTITYECVSGNTLLRIIFLSTIKLHRTSQRTAFIY